MINCKEDLYGTYIENDNGELRNLYLSKCQEFGLSINDACHTTRSTLIFAKEGFDRFGNVDHATVVDFIISKYDVTKELTLSDLKSEPEVEWGNGLPPVGVECEWIGGGLIHGDWGLVIVHAYHKGFAWIEKLHDNSIKTVYNPAHFRKPESPEEKEKRERLEAAYDLYVHVQTVMNKPFSNYDWFLKKGDGNQLDKCLAIVDKTNYRKTN